MAFGEMEEFPNDLTNYNTLPVEQFGANSWSYFQIQSVDLSGNKLKSIPYEFFANNPEISKVILNSNLLEDFAYDLSLMPNLKQLNLDDNLLTKLNLVSNLGSLVLLTVNKNKIKNLELHGTNNLEKLEANSNLITKYNLANLVKLKYLDVSSNQIAAVDSNMSQLASLEHLIMSRNRIANLDINSLQLKNLKILDLSLNKLTAFELDYRIENLDTLNIGFNQIKAFNSYSKITGATVIDLKNNALDGLSADVRFCQKLTTLDVSNNNIKDLPNYLGLMAKLVRLSLEGNQLTRIRSSIRFSGVDNIKKYLVTRMTPEEHETFKNLDIAQNNNIFNGDDIDFVEQTMRNANASEVTLKNIDLSVALDKKLREFLPRYDKFKSFYDHFQDTSADVYSRIYSDTATYEHKVLQYMAKYNNKFPEGISKVHFEGCSLILVPSLILHNQLVAANIREIYLSKNKISVLDKVLFGLPNLTHLDLSWNLLTDASLQMQAMRFEWKHLKCKYLHWLDLSNNKGLTKIPLFLNWTPHINFLHMGNCNVDRVNELFLLKTAYNNLETLDLSYNQLDSFIENEDFTEAEMCACLPMLKNFNLSYNKIKNLPLWLDQLPSLEKLNIYANYIKLSKFDFAKADTQEVIEYVRQRNGGEKKELVNKESVMAIKIQDQTKEQILGLEAEIKKLNNKLTHDTLLGRSDKYNIKMDIEDKKEQIQMLKIKLGL